MKRVIGRTNVEVNAIGLGGMPMSIKNRPSEDEAIKVIHAAVDAGVDFIDTANVYCLDNSDIGHNERLIQKALASYQGAIKPYVATKAGLTRPEGRWETDGKPDSIRKSCEQSLKALNVNEIFLYQLHAPDDDVPFEESVGAFARLQEEGKVIHIGISNVNAEEIEKAQSVVRVETVQNRLNPMCQRDLHNEVLKKCQENGMTYIAYSPVGGGFGHSTLAVHDSLMEVADKYRVTTYQVMLSWCLKKGENILPIPGASQVSSIQSSVKAVDIPLDEDDVKAVDEISVFI